MVRLRFAPSPTGFLHLGNIRTALLNWLFARHHGGSFLLRMDDTDLQRSQETYGTAIKEDLLWLGLQWDRYEQQSHHKASYQKAIERLTKSGRLYPCYETPEELAEKRKKQTLLGKPPIYDRASLHSPHHEDRTPHWRFLLSLEPVTWEDQVRGRVSYHAKNLSDPIVVREDGSISYLLSSVVNDAEWDITHIIRGEDHVTNTAIQIQLFQALSAPVPCFAHVPLVHDLQGTKLSKRSGGEELSLRSLREAGILPVTVCSVLAALGTGHAPHVVTKLPDLIPSFCLEDYGRSSPSLDPAQFFSVNQNVFAHMTWEEVCTLCPSAASLSPQQWHILRDNITVKGDLEEWVACCTQTEKRFPRDTLCGTDFFLVIKEALKALDHLPPQTENFWKIWMEKVSAQVPFKGKALYLPLRLALTGKATGPQMHDLVRIFSRELLQHRLTLALTQ